MPYIAHLLAVTAIVLESGGDEETAIAALLHDAVEDQGGQPTLDRIRREFGERVARIVHECSDADGEPKPPWRFRKEQYLAGTSAQVAGGPAGFIRRQDSQLPLHRERPAPGRRIGLEPLRRPAGKVPFGTIGNCLRSFPGSRMLRCTTNLPPLCVP